MTTHASLSGADLHENKGVAGASDNTIATAVSGATVWRTVSAASIDLTTIFNINKVYITTQITSVSTAETVYTQLPFSGTLTAVYATLQGPLTGANATITVTNNAGLSAGTITITTTGSTAGQKYTLTPTSNNTFVSGDNIGISTGGGSTGTAKLFITYVFTVTG